MNRLKIKYEFKNASTINNNAGILYYLFDMYFIRAMMATIIRPYFKIIMSIPNMLRVKAVFI